MINGPDIAPRAAATLMQACATRYHRLSIDLEYHMLRTNLLGLHLLGRISLGTQYASGTEANPKPIKI